MAQMGFFDLSDRTASPDASRDPLVGIDALVPREAFRPALDRVWRKPAAARKARAGRKPMDAVVMFKTLVPGALCTLSDDRIEYRVRDRLSFVARATTAPGTMSTWTTGTGRSGGITSATRRCTTAGRWITC
jgi:hypothetical protein